jgi:hypothetical protein
MKLMRWIKRSKSKFYWSCSHCRSTGAADLRGVETWYEEHALYRSHQQQSPNCPANLFFGLRLWFNTPPPPDANVDRDGERRQRAVRELKDASTAEYPWLRWRC